MWTLIGRYQIRSSGRGLSTKAALKEWLDTLIPEYGIRNFNTDWNDGRPLCALVDRLQPGLCSNHKSLSTQNGLENCKLGMKLAEDNFDIPPVIDPEDMNNPEVDDLSIMTYISYFFRPAMAQLLEWIHKKIPQRGVTNLSTDWNTGVNLAALMEACHAGLFPDWEDLDPHKAKENLEASAKIAHDRLDIKCPVKPASLSDPKVDEIVVATYLSRFKYSKLLTSADDVIVYAPTLKDGSGIVNQPVEIEVELGSTAEATLSHLTFVAIGPNSETAVVTVGKPKKSITIAEFVPKVDGIFTVSCQLNDDEVEGCPLKIPVIDPSKWSLLDNIPEVMQMNKPITVQVQGDSHGSKPVVACESFIDTGEKNPEPTSNNKDKVPYTDGSNSPGKEKPAKVQPKEDSGLVIGLGKPAIVGEEFTFSLKPDKLGKVDVLIQGPTISYTPEIENDPSNDDNQHLVNFIPEEVGLHTVDISIDDRDVDGSPFTLSVIEERPELEVEEEKEKSDGDNDETIEKDKGEYDITNESRDDGKGGEEDDMEEVEEEAPNNKKPKQKAQFIQTSISPFEDGKCKIYILPTETGKAKTHITIGGVDVKNSPFSMSVVDASKCYMSNLENKTFLVQQPVTFEVNAADSAIIPKVTIEGSAEKYTPDIETVMEGEGVQYCYTFTPENPGIVKISVKVENEHIPSSPCTIQISEPAIISDVPNYLEEGKVYNLDTLIDYNLKQEPTVSITTDPPSDTPLIDASIIKNEAMLNHWKLVLKALAPGTATVHVKIGNYHVKKSPFLVKVSAISQCRVEGMEDPLQLAQPFVFHVIMEEGLTQKPEVMLYTPSSRVPLVGTDNGDGSHAFTFTPIQLGVMRLAILFGGQDIPGSPFSKTVETPNDAKNCRAYGPSLHPNAVLQIGRPIEFCVDTTKAGQGELQVIAQGPRKHNPKVLMAEENGTYTLRIDAPHPGWYQVHVWWSQVHIPNSPFRLKAHHVADPSKVRVYGVGVSREIEIKRPAEFHILTKDAGMGTLTVNVHGVKNAFKVDVAPEDPSNPRTLVCVYHPTEAGNYRVTVQWSGTDVPGSPFSVTVTDKRFEIEQARLEERRKEKMKRLESQKKILEQQNISVRKAMQAMPDFRKQAALSLSRGGQLAGSETVTHKEVHHQRQRQKLVRNASANAVLQTQSLSNMSKEKQIKTKNIGRQEIIAAPQKETRKKKLRKTRSTSSVQSAMQKNAHFLGNSLRGGVTPMWLPSTTEAPSVEEINDISIKHPNPVIDETSTAKINPLPQAITQEADENDKLPLLDDNDALPDELPVTITPLYENTTEVEEVQQQPSVKSKKRSKRSSKKR